MWEGEVYGSGRPSWRRDRGRRDALCYCGRESEEQDERAKKKSLKERKEKEGEGKV